MTCFWAQSRWDTSNLKSAASTRSFSRFLAASARRDEPSLNTDWFEGLDVNIKGMGGLFSTSFGQYLLNDLFRFFNMLVLILCCRI